MNLIFIYGQPGIGKLTVAKELTKTTGYKLFHNHLTADAVYSLFPFGTKACFDLSDKIRLDLLEAAAKNKINGVIFTYVYGQEIAGKRTDDVFVARAVKVMKRHKSRIFFVKLICQEKELRRRLRNPSRKNFRKLTRVKNLLSTRKKWILDATLPFGESYVVDNTRLSPKKVAVLIKDHYRL